MLGLAKEVKDEKLATVLSEVKRHGAISPAQTGTVAVGVDASGALAQMRSIQPQSGMADTIAKADAGIMAQLQSVSSMVENVPAPPKIPEPPHVEAPAAAPTRKERKHGASLAFSAIEGAMAKKAKLIKADMNVTKVVADPEEEKSKADSEQFETGGMRFFDRIIPATDDDYPYQCACKRKSAASVIPLASLSEAHANANVALAAGKNGLPGDMTGHCKEDVSEPCMAIPGDNAAMLSVALIAAVLT